MAEIYTINGFGCFEWVVIGCGTSRQYAVPILAMISRGNIPSALFNSTSALIHSEPEY